MALELRRFRFIAAVIAVIVAMALALLGKSFFSNEEDTASKGGPGRGAPIAVTAADVATKQFYDKVETIGTAQANESVTISAKVTEVIRRIRLESGQMVAKGQVLVELTTVEQSADLAEAQAALEAQRRDAERFEELGRQGFASAAQLEATRARLQQAEARVEALQSRIGDRVIRAPFAGVMGLRMASPGALAGPNDVIGTLDDISVIKLDFDVAESQMAMVAKGSEVTARTAAFPDQTFTGRIDSIDTRVDPTSRTLKVRALIPNRQGLLKPGMLMTVESRSNPRDAPAIPEIAVIERAGESFVFVIEQGERGPTVRETAIRTGKRAGGFVEVLEGAPQGAQIVVDGVQRVRPGQSVKIDTGGTPAAATEDRGKAR